MLLPHLMFELRPFTTPRIEVHTALDGFKTFWMLLVPGTDGMIPLMPLQPILNDVFYFRPRENGEVSAALMLKFAPDIRAPVDPLSKLREFLRASDELKILTVKLQTGESLLNIQRTPGITNFEGNHKKVFYIGSLLNREFPMHQKTKVYCS